MSKLLFFLLIFASTNCFDDFHKRNVSKKIIGGHDCSIEQYPFMISLRNKKLRHFCGGSLIKPDWVLTAAHCFPDQNPNFYIVVAGTSEINKNGVQRRTVEKLVIHEKYNAKKFNHDIALLKLTEEFQIIPHQVTVISLPFSEILGDVRIYCETATVIGWGHRDSWNPEGKTPLYYNFNPVLQCVKIPVLTQQECEDLRGKKLRKGVFCAYAENGGKDSCQGDSGGPLFCGNVQYGVVSNGYGCGLPKSPGYYTRVDQYLNFIRLYLDHSEDSSDKAGGYRTWAIDATSEVNPRGELEDLSGDSPIECYNFMVYAIISVCVIKYS